MTLTTHRTERFRVEHLTRTDASLGYLDGIRGGRLEWNANAILPGGGSVSLVDQEGQEINLSQDRVRLWWEVDGNDPWPLGVYVLAAPSVMYSPEGTTRDITLIDKMTVIHSDLLTQTLQIPAGANIIQQVVLQIQASGEQRIASTPSAATLSNSMSWEPGTSRLRVINDLLNTAGYWALWTDGAGQFRVEPYLAPAARPVSWSFEEGQAAIHSPFWEYEVSLWEATNTVVLVSQENDLGVIWTASAIDDNPDSPTSTVSMGRALNPIVEENVEAASQADLQAQATRRLIDNSNVIGKIRVSHAVVPIWYNQAVRFKSQGMDTTATVTKMTLNLIPGSLVSAEWRQA